MKLFTGATLKLAGWYLLILMSVSLLFSVIIFQVALSEVQTRLDRIMEQRELALQYILISPEPPQDQLNTATANLLISLAYINLIVLLTGGAGAYLLAKHTLKPIQQAHEAQSRFVANASHQLRTPLAIIKAETELALNSKKINKTELQQTLTSNLEEVNHLSQLSNMLLEMSRSEQDLKSINDHVDLVSVIREILTNRKILTRTNLETPDSVSFTSYEAAVREIFNILIDNAMKHSPKKSPINIQITQTKQSITCKISNQGRGLTEKQLKHIFERFYRTGSSDGYGLGLSLAKQLVKALGGSIAAASQIGKGATFTVTLPK